VACNNSRSSRGRKMWVSRTAVEGFRRPAAFPEKAVRLCSILETLITSEPAGRVDGDSPTAACLVATRWRDSNRWDCSTPCVHDLCVKSDNCDSQTHTGFRGTCDSHSSNPEQVRLQHALRTRFVCEVRQLWQSDSHRVQRNARQPQFQSRTHTTIHTGELALLLWLG